MSKTFWVAISGVLVQLILVFSAWGFSSFSTSVSPSSLNIDAKSQVGQVSGRIILDPRFGTDSNADGLVTCNRGYHIGDKASCGPCQFLATIQRVLNFAFVIATIVATIMFAYAGFLYLSSSTNPGNIAKAKGIFWNVLFGFVAVLAAWIVVNTVLNILYNRSLLDVSAIACENDRRDEAFLPNPDAGQAVQENRASIRRQIAGIDESIAILKAEKLNCLAGGAGSADTGDIAPADEKLCSTIDRRISELEQSKVELTGQLVRETPYAGLAGGTTPGAPIGGNPNAYIPVSTLTDSDAAFADNATKNYDAMIRAEIARQGGTITPELARAILSAESGGNVNAVSGVGAVGLMQIMPSTARQYLPANYTDAQVRQALLNPATNIEIGIKVLNANAANPNVRNQNDLIASYNSGAGNQLNASGKKPALAASSDCPGARAYECSINPGGLTETRNYVARVNYYNEYYSNQNKPSANVNAPNAGNLKDETVDLNF